MSLTRAVEACLKAGRPQDLWRLRGELLAGGLSVDAPALRVLGKYYRYLTRLETNTDSRRFSELASVLDISALAGVFLQDLLCSPDPGKKAHYLLSGALGEGLMVLATRQHVKAWESEEEAGFRDAAWGLYEELWRWSEAHNPDLPPEDRRSLLDVLLAKVVSDDTSALERAVLLGRLYQLLLATYLAGDLADP
jgi:hypothetical protein